MVNLAVGPVIVTGSVIFISPSVKTIVLAPANTVGSNVIVSARPVLAFAKLMASRRLRSPAEVLPSFSSVAISTTYTEGIATTILVNTPAGTAFGVGLSASDT